MPDPTNSPPFKRIKLESSTPGGISDDAVDNAEEEEHCAICLQAIVDRTLISICSHEFCFECLLVWCEQSRRCPLCSQTIGAYLIHHIRSKYDYQKHFLPPLRTSPPPLQTISGRALLAPGSSNFNSRRPFRRERRWGRREREEREEMDALERAIARRRWVYQHHLYAKHVASNAFTRYRPYPTPSQFSASPDLIKRATIFLRRELRVWPNSDVEFLTMFTISLMKSIDIRSESAVKLLAEFLDMDTPYVDGGRFVNAEHFAHEIYSYMRSPYRDLANYDASAQYDIPSDIPPPPAHERSRRWFRSQSRSRSRSPTFSESSESSASSARISRLPRQSPSRSRPRSPSYRGRRHRDSLDDAYRQSAQSHGHRDESETGDTRRHYDSVKEGKRHRHGRSSQRHRRRSRSQSRSPVRDKGKRFTRRDVSSRVEDIQPETMRLSETPSISRALASTSVGASRDRTEQLNPDEQGGNDTSTTQLTPDLTDAVSPPSERVMPRARPRPITQDRVRHRNLRDSIQAHLRSGPSSMSAHRQVSGFKLATITTSTPISIPTPQAATADGPQSPLERVLDNDEDVAMSSSAERRAVATTPVGMNGKDRPPKGLSMSAPEIMARTRARVLQMREVAATDPCGSRTHDDTPSSRSHPNATLNPVTAPASAPTSASTSCSPSRQSGISRRGHGDTENPTGPGATAVAPDFRARLLDKLETERQITLWDSNPGAVDGNAHSADAEHARTSGAPVPMTRERQQASDAEQMEAQPRAQAQLRVRLAAAQRHAVGKEPEGRGEDASLERAGTSCDRDVGGNFAAKADENREEALRERLRRRRK